MANIIITIVPIFMVILLGLALRPFGLMEEGFVRPANQLVYYVAIPAMLFREVSEAALADYFSVSVVGAAVLPPVVFFFAGLVLTRIAAFPRQQVGTLLQCSFHGNLGYIGLAVSYYFLGSEGFTKASILAGFLMLIQNFLSVLALSRSHETQGERLPPGRLIRRVVLNPIILAAAAGILFSLARWQLPTIVDRSLKILSGMALPLALLVIGTSLSFGQLRRHLPQAIAITLSKLILLPATGLALFHLFRLSKGDSLPALILLASPTATVSYVMAREMAGDPDLATAAISVTTLVSGVTYTFWLGLYG
jgi:predicted permease